MSKTAAVAKLAGVDKLIAYLDDTSREKLCNAAGAIYCLDTCCNDCPFNSAHNLGKLKKELTSHVKAKQNSNPNQP